ncbi:glycoside hydrolase family 18 protein [Trichoderma citrinoviride]|uniref:Glycoside hydrolase family 18 protein n=1 Tax=Trichoderma citrinoviride TaxID=58853 RepID=A0A2T4B1A5_9HYPO|nr:glycoside hydrolase family 18 protein [Trichoderma citrinoviride]PTB63107.1 glycoside hydrolase family 18 protein [Trichoderma citrinoviride]
MKASVYLASLLATLSLAAPVKELQQRAEPTDLPRLIVYFQTTHDSSGQPISMLPLITEKGIALTHLIVCSLHINQGGEVHLNDYPPDDPHFYTLWNETISMKQAGVTVMGMVGGAAPGSFNSQTLDSTDDATFEHYYGQLHDVIVNFQLQGMDLDVEQPMSQAGIARLVARLRADFGPDFLITLAPVASALENSGNLSGFDYNTLQQAQGADIDWYNTQFYSGFGSMADTGDYDRIVANGFSPATVVAGQLTAPDGAGWIPTSNLNTTIISLVQEYGQIGGVMGWEYFNSLPGGTAEPWEWAQIVTEILRPGLVPELKITDEDAARLSDAYEESVKAGNGGAGAADKSFVKKPAVNYYAMVNA